MTASRMRACACDTTSRLCVRTVLCRSAFSLAPPLRSTSSAAAEAALFARFRATTGRSDFSIALIVGYGLRPSRQRPGHDGRGRRWRSPGSRATGFCACLGLRRRGASMCLAISTPAVLPSVGRKTSAPRTCLTPLNTSPAPSPVNASRLPSRAARASLGAGAVRYSFTVTDFHRLPLAGLPAHSPTHDGAARPPCFRRRTIRETLLLSCAHAETHDTEELSAPACCILWSESSLFVRTATGWRLDPREASLAQKGSEGRVTEKDTQLGSADVAFERLWEMARDARPPRAEAVNQAQT